MGNPAWGHGYGQGHAAGMKQGGIVGSAVSAGVIGLVAGVKFLYDKKKDARTDSADSPSQDSPGELRADQN